MAKVEIEIRDSSNSVEGVLEIGSDLSFPLSLTKSIASLNSLAKRGGVFSKTFKIPATKNNNKLLVNLYSANQRNIKAMKQKKDALILVDGVIIERGYIKILDSLVGKRPEKYTLKFFGDNLDWVTQLGELDLHNVYSEANALAFPIPGAVTDTQTYSQNAIQLLWSNTWDQGRDFVYPWISYGQYINGLGVTVEDMRLAIRWRGIIERGLVQTGYTLVSDFMDTDDFKQLIFPHVGDGFKYSQAIRDEEAIYVTLPTSTPANLFNGLSPAILRFIGGTVTGSGASNYVTATGVYTIPRTAMFNFKFNFTFTPLASMLDFPIELKRFVNGVEDTPTATFTSCDTNSILTFNARNLVLCSQGFSNNVIDNPGEPDDGNRIPITNVETETGFQRYNTGDTVEFYFVYQNTNPQGNTLPIGNFTITTDSWMKVEMSDRIIENGTYKVSDIVKRDMPVLDLFNDLTKCFNLYWRTDVKTKQVFVEPRDTFYKPITDAIDWSDKLDIKKTPKLMFITEAYKRELIFKYVGDLNDEFVKARNEEKQNELGSYVHTFPDRFIKGRQALSTKQISPTYWMQDDNAITTLGIHTAPVTARLWNEVLPNNSPPPAFYDYNPRILNFRYGGQTGENGQLLAWKWENVESPVIPYAIMSPIYGGNVSAAYNLSFNGSDGLFETYYGRSIKLIEDGIRLEAFFHLKSTDIRTDLRTPIYLSKPDELQGYWVIDKIHDWSPVKDKTTRVTLIKLINYDSVTADTGQTPTDPEKVPIDKGGGRSLPGGGTTETDTASKEGRSSIVAANGTGNMAAKGSGSIAFGQGCIAPGKNQSIVGRYPKINDTDVYAIGVGEDENSRLTAFKIDKDGNPQTYGGEVQIADSDGRIVPIFITGTDDKVKKVYLKS
jgi:hypothetical protein